MKENDWIDQLFIANTHNYLLCFSDRGRVYWLKVWEVPQGTRGSRGRPIVNMFPLADGEKITVVLPVKEFSRSEEHTSELQSLMRISYAVFCLKKKKQKCKL